uniref:Uncharacterized protein n=1 Tax=Bracon brevicornis TaxID=1563983 RepID=A0A6V7KUV8_9HYME
MLCSTAKTEPAAVKTPPRVLAEEPQVLDMIPKPKQRTIKTMVEERIFHMMLRAPMAALENEILRILEKLF